MRICQRVVIVAMCGWAAGGQAQAQTADANRPYRGLFPPPSLSGPSAPAKPAGAFECSIRVFGGIERDASGEAAGGARPGGPYSALAADIARTHAGARLSYEVRGSSQVRAQPSAGGFFADTQWLAAGAQALLSPRTTITLAQRFAYSPLYSPSTSGVSGAAGADPGRGADSNSNVTMITAAGVSRQISRLTTAAFGYGFDRVRFSDSGAVASSQRAAASLTHALGRALDVQLKSSSLWSSSNGGSPATSAHELTAGFIATPKRTRTTEISIGIAPGLSRRTEPITASASPSIGVAATRTSLVIGGFAKITRQLSRNWRADAGYQRMTYFLPGGDQLISANAFTGGVNGALGQRLVLSGSAGFSLGSPDQRQAQQHVKSLTASGRIEWRPAHNSAIFVEVRRDAYVVSDGLTQLPELSRNATTSSMRVGMSLGFGGTGLARGRR